MNNRGSSALYLFMLFVVIIILALALAFPLIQNSNEARGSSGLDCSNAVTYQDKANCYATDALPFFFIAILLGIGIVVIKGVAK